MDPTGGLGLPILVAIIVAIIAMWVFAPFGWALGVSLVLLGLFVAFIVAVFSTARFT